MADDFTFNYSSGPTQRFVIEMARDGLRVRNALPGGAVWVRTSFMTKAQKSLVSLAGPFVNFAFAVLLLARETRRRGAPQAEVA